jgi:hypothetical protein
VTIELCPASSFELGELAGIFTNAYEGYVVPISEDATLAHYEDLRGLVADLA